MRVLAAVSEAVVLVQVAVLTQTRVLAAVLAQGSLLLMVAVELVLLRWN